ncbi:class I SAM-dependent methyltransferase [Patescibacteria group bacterium]|nr:class I SAM-dependent methyltransferase [Patescibacteria group bacterium]
MIEIFTTNKWKDYELIDTGEGEKLERFGPYTFVRPYEGSVWKKTFSAKEWAKADGKFWSSKGGAKAGWKMISKLPKKWEMSYQGVKFLASPTPFRHLGFFPEQAPHWDFISEQIKNAKKPVRFLNLFGYTGVASLVALEAGAEVTHVDASKQTIDWVKENQKASGLENSTLRVIPEDAIKFLEREIKRGNKYDAVIMDPPKFGRGPKGETWKIEEDLGDLLSKVRQVLSPEALFVILTSYSIDASSISIGNAMRSEMQSLGGEVIQGELCIKEKSNGRLISLANTAVWKAK